ncbi:MAG: hypothetical protein ABSG53_09025, partial [Thermoguttaceae bacterium]
MNASLTVDPMIILISPPFACTPASPQRHVRLIYNFCFKLPVLAAVAARQALLQHRFHAAAQHDAQLHL